MSHKPMKLLRLTASTYSELSQMLIQTDIAKEFKQRRYFRPNSLDTFDYNRYKRERLFSKALLEKYNEFMKIYR